MQRAQPVDKPVDHMWGARGDLPMSETDLAKVWARSLEELAEMHIEPAQRAWLQLTRPLGLVENTALIATPNEFVKEQLETRLRALITNALSRELGRSIQLAVTIDPAAAAAPPAAGDHSHNGAAGDRSDEPNTAPMPAITDLNDEPIRRRIDIPGHPADIGHERSRLDGSNGTGRPISDGEMTMGLRQRPGSPPADRPGTGGQPRFGPGAPPPRGPRPPRS